MKVASVEISHPDKLMYPQAGLSKADVVNYYDRIAERMLPYLKDRPLSLQRFPDGIDNDGFYQKKAADYFPDFIERVTIPTQEGENVQVLCNNKQSLIYLVNQGTISFHRWLSRADKLDQPDLVVYDLDPPKDAFDQVVQCARLLRKKLREEGHDPALMTTGQAGLHLYYAINREENFEQLRERAHQLADELAAEHPQLMTTETRIAKRKGRIFIDYLRNAYAQTAVCPYSLRANAYAGVATPIAWRELSRLKGGDHYHVKNIFRRLAQK